MRGELTVPQRKGSNGPTIEGQLEMALGAVGDGCDFLYVARDLITRGLQMMDRAYQSGATGYRMILVAKDGGDPGDAGLPPRERAAVAGAS